MDSTLSSNAPEFIPELKKVTQDGYLKIKRSVKSSKIFTTGKFDSLKTFPAFKSVISDFSRYVTSQIEEILVAEIPKIVFSKEEDEQCKEDYIEQANNNILERFNRNLEAFCEMSHSPVTHKNEQNIPRSGDRPKNVDQVEVDQYDINMAQALATTSDPQVYNIKNIWVPIIFEKPNYLVPFELKLLYDESGKATGYEHPYRIELEEYAPPSYLIDAVAEPISFPAPLKNTNYTFINTLPNLENLICHLRDVDEMAVDVEHHSFRAYLGVTCLVQITTYKGDFIIDAMALRQHLYKLNCPFTDPKKIKVLHGADMDVLWLQRDLGVYIVGLFDTYQAAITLNIKYKSLQALLQMYCKINTNKKFQTADWRVRPLPYLMVRYARTDTHYLLYIWKRMKNQLLEMERCGEKQLLKKVFNMSKNVCLSVYKKHMVTETSHLSLYKRYLKDFTLSSRSLVALKKLYKWRDDYAKELNEGPAYVLPNTMMLTLAAKLPENLKTIRKYCPSARKVLRRNFIKILEMLKVCRDMPEPPPVVMPQRFRCRKKPRHMLDLPNKSTSGCDDNLVMHSEDLKVFDSYRQPYITTISTGSGDHRFTSPYLRYMKCVEVEQKKKKKQVIRMFAVAENTNAENDLTEFIPIFKSRETREREAKERANENPAAAENDDDAGEGTSDGFTLVTRRKRKSRGKNDAQRPEESKPTASTKRVYYQYTNPNYKSFYNPRDKAMAKFLSNKRN